jgi:thiamine pyrophosphate-dependent acetolactate synthase large subunit-like protein
VGKNVQAALAICADSGGFLAQLEEALAAKPDPGKAARLEPWHGQVKAACDQTRQARQAWLAKKSTPMGPQELFRGLRGVLPADAVVVLDGSVTLAAGQAILSARTPCGWLDPGWNGCMGSGIPFAMGAKLAAPERLVVVVCGDFGFGLSALELQTAVRHRIPIIIVIANNDSISSVNRQKTFFPPGYPELFSRFQPGLRYERIMEVFGGPAEWVVEPADLGPALERAAASGLPACINVSVDPDAP